ncbi:Extracellular matrix glycoprotein Laminin subunits alpha and gamma [Pseudoloma neurophilia]|uniref:Extracellular matrix glycoprotein Laminin subunits alpha and gamma n=1 Tax=Pseudoloma neurophilia TaxID=146866 RepID=A0A0R0M4G9_9MICR|nr:Extracellular matrix glycoprotein Laminin subunits alpha and gamma [Pseudoloma neurophilia]
MSVDLQESILKCQNIADKLEKISKIQPRKGTSKQLMPQIIVDQKKKENLRQLVPFCQDVSKNLVEYLTNNLDVFEKHKQIEEKYMMYKEITEDDVLKESYTRMNELQTGIQQMEAEISKLKAKVFVNYENSINTFENVAEAEGKIKKPQYDLNFSELNDLIEEKYAFDVVGVSENECEIIEEIVTFLEGPQ